MSKPLLLIVTGQPGSGKTTLAKKLAAEIHCPLLCRDEFKEGYVHTHGSSRKTVGSRTNLEVYDAFFASIAFLLSKKISLIAEAAFQHKLWAPKLEGLQKESRLRLVVCQTTPELARQRRLQRGRLNPDWQRFHGDTDKRLNAQDVTYHPPDLPVPTLYVTTTEGYDPSLAEIAAFLLKG